MKSKAKQNTKKSMHLHPLGLAAVNLSVAGVVIAAMNVSLHVSGGTADQIKRDILPQLRATASEIEQDLRRGQSSSPPVAR